MAELESYKATAQQALTESAGHRQDIGQIFKRLLSLEQAEQNSKVPTSYPSSLPNHGIPEIYLLFRD